jgi:tetratricopeptide (TPR) repeat protein
MPKLTREQRSAGLLGREVAITGRLASMSRGRALELLAAVGGTLVETPRAGTAYLFVGQGGPPLGDDGRRTHALVRAEELQLAGSALVILGEEELLELLGLEEERGSLRRATTTGELARILEVPQAAIRSWVREGLIRPERSHGRLHLFSFSEVANAKALVGLFRSGVSSARLKRSLELLRGQVDNVERMLGQLEVLAYAGPLYVRAADGGLAEPNGQRCFEFEASGAPATRLYQRAAERSLEEWVDIGLRAEREGRVEDAVRAYRSALARDERHADVQFNLGNALYALGQFEESLERYHRAVELAPDYIEAWNNLGILLGEMNRPEEAVRAYRRALSLAPDYPDALYNLAETLVSRGELEEARRLWRAYLRVDPQSPFARIVRERLTRLS